MHDLTRFTLSDMIHLSSALRGMSTGLSTMEQVARRMVDHLHNRLLDRAAGRRACVLVRFYKTHPFEDLEPDLQAFARSMLGGHREEPGLRCLTLLATAGERPEWNDRTKSRRHRAIPLPSEKMVASFPMISQLISQFGLEVAAVLGPDPSVIMNLEQRTYNVFHIPEAEGSPYVPDQEGFVTALGVRSVLGFGGLLPQGDLFALILFSRVHISRETAGLFKPLALSAKLSLLPFLGGPVFNREATPEEAGTPASGVPTAAETGKRPLQSAWERRAEDAALLGSRVAALEELLQVGEQAVLEQASRLEEALEEIRGLLEALPDAVVVTDGHGNVARVNTQAERMFGYSREELLGKSISLVLPEHFQEEILEHCARYFTHEGAQPINARWELHARRKDQSRFPVDVLLSPRRGEEGLLIISLIRDITDRKRAEEALRASETRTRSIIGAAHDAFIAMDAGGYIIDWNHQAELTFGWRREEAIGRSLGDTIVPPRYRELHRQGLRTFLATGEAEYLNRRFEIEALHRNGHEFTVELTITPIRLGAAWIFSAFVHDITERKRKEEELRQVAAELERSNQELEEFASVASHDLQEPLRKILAFGDRLKAGWREPLGPEGRDYLERMQNSAARMQTLIRDLLAYSRVMRGGQPFVAVDLDQVVREVLSDLEVSIAEKGAQVEVEELPTIEADRTQMRQLFQNLIGNALKFRRPGEPPRVSISAGEPGNGAALRGLCRIEVADNGIGFEEKYRERIFGIFQRLHSRSEYEGTGMGLAICRKIVQRHGGTISARSTPGRGTVFTMELPLRQAAVHTEERRA